MATKKLHRMSRVMPGKELDSVSHARSTLGERRAFEVLWQAQQYSGNGDTILTQFGDILEEGETPYEHKSHPYVFKTYPFIDGEIHTLLLLIFIYQVTLFLSFGFKCEVGSQSLRLLRTDQRHTSTRRRRWTLA